MLTQSEDIVGQFGELLNQTDTYINVISKAHSDKVPGVDMLCPDTWKYRGEKKSTRDCAQIIRVVPRLPGKSYATVMKWRLWQNLRFSRTNVDSEKVAIRFTSLLLANYVVLKALPVRSRKGKSQHHQD